jgi:hypothetical protein
MPRRFVMRGLARASISKRLFKKMDCPVKPGNDDLLSSEFAQVNSDSDA